MLLDALKRVTRRFGVDVVRFPARTHSPLAKLLREREIQTVIDVGANIGQYGMRLRHLEAFTGQIVSVEPDPASFSLLTARASRDSRWSTHRIALGETHGAATLHVAELSVLSSLRSPSAYGVETDSRIRASHEITVEVTTLDALISEISVRDPVFLKVDTQGYERPILAGATSTLARAEALQIELSLKPLYENQPVLPEMFALVEDLGFQPWALMTGYVDPKSGAIAELDGLFVRV